MTTAEAQSAMVGAITDFSYTYASEDALQELLATALRSSGFDVVREHRLDRHSRVDLFCGDVAIEVKVDGTRRAVERQLLRYAQHESVQALILVTTKACHLSLPDSIGGVPLRVVALLGGGL